MKKLILGAFAIALIACKTENNNEKPADYAVFSGTITNTNEDILNLSGNGLEEEVAILENGTFSDTIMLDKSGYYTFRVGRERAPLYLTPGATLQLTLDASQFDESITFSGSEAAENNFLAKKTLIIEKHLKQSKELFSLDPTAFEQKLNALQEELNKNINAYPTLSETFKEEQATDIKYIHLVNIDKYPRYHAYYTKQDTTVVYEPFKKQLEAVNYDDDAAANASGYYRQLVVNNFMDTLYNEDQENPDTLSIGQKGIAMLDKLKSQKIKDIIAKQMAYEIRPGNDDATLLYEKLTAVSSDKNFISELNEKYDKIKNLIKGKPSPTFAYQNYKGGTTSLEDLRGNYVYVDVWATWCGPCKREIPYLKEVEKAYHDKNITFVSISIDQEKDKETWKKMIEEEELGGVQLFAEAAWKSKFATAYAIEGIPRFIIIDPEGNIVSADAPRPSDPKLKELFNSFQL